MLAKVQGEDPSRDREGAVAPRPGGAAVESLPYGRGSDFGDLGGD